MREMQIAFKPNPDASMGSWLKTREVPDQPAAERATGYDAAYVALAEALGCPRATRDSRLVRSRGHDAEIRVVEVAGGVPRPG